MAIAIKIATLLGSAFFLALFYATPVGFWVSLGGALALASIVVVHGTQEADPD